MTNTSHGPAPEIVTPENYVPDSKTYAAHQAAFSLHDCRLTKAHVVGRGPEADTYVLLHPYESRRNLTTWHDVVQALAALARRPTSRRRGVEGIALDKRIKTLQARAALLGVAVETIQDDHGRESYVVTAGSLTRAFSSLTQIENWLHAYQPESEVRP